MTTPGRIFASKRVCVACAVLFWTVAWQALYMLVGHDVLLASPTSVVIRLSELVPTLGFWQAVGTSLARISIGFLLAAILGTLAAVASFRIRIARTLLTPLLGAVKATPVASFVILVLIWVPSRDLSTVISLLMAFPLVYTNVLEGLDATNRDLLDSAAVLGIQGWGLVRCVYAPQLLPYAQAALSLAFGMCWKAGIAAEVIGMPAGTIGEHLYDAKVYLQTPDLFAWTLVIVIVSLLLECAFRNVLNIVVQRVFRMH